VEQKDLAESGTALSTKRNCSFSYYEIQV